MDLELVDPKTGARVVIRDTGTGTIEFLRDDVALFELTSDDFDNLCPYDHIGW